ncbi:hypothetical protein SRB5_07970 [Streptomyces sp. RB5]|uniref:Lipoprotein n=1 Tax=Streptomyces smaragdinus TaxID=2585196 RepID=A0A7K0CD52_9ACTN|nr:hypothetical protein [Streptomyces smaragdinus]MQY10684.1 hypothetical protein [Streptomyces smaragdinus]
MGWRKFLTAACALALTAGVGAVSCGDESAGAGTRARTAGYEGCDGRDATYDPAYPDFSAEDAQDWVSFGDHVAVFRIEDQRGAKQHRSGRLVVEQMIYSRAGAPRTPKSFRTELWDVPCKSWLTPGHTYVGLLVRDSIGPKDAAAWHPVYGSGVLPYDGKRIGHGEIEGRKGAYAFDDLSPFWLGRQMFGEHATTLQSLLFKTEPYSAAADHPRLSPGERFELARRQWDARQAASGG